MPNHASPLDAPVLAALMPLRTVRMTFWAAKARVVLKTRLRRVLSRLARIIPIPEDRSALVPTTAVLRSGKGLVWFPEGSRSLDGRLQKFKHGIASLIWSTNSIVVPVWIEGANAAFPGRGYWPRFFSRIEVRFGPAIFRSDLRMFTDTPEETDRVAQSLRDRLETLRCGCN